MTKPLKRDYGWKPPTAANGRADEKIYGWAQGDQDGYYAALKAWENSPKKSGGRPRSTQIHPSWIPYLPHFNPYDPRRSQGAFARWLGVNPATVSGAKRKQISPNMAADIERWAQSMEG